MFRRAGAVFAISPPVAQCSRLWDPVALQDLVDVLPDVVKAAAGVRLSFRLHIQLGDGEELDSALVTAIDGILASVSADLRLKG